MNDDEVARSELACIFLGALGGVASLATGAVTAAIAVMIMFLAVGGERSRLSDEQLGALALGVAVAAALPASALIGRILAGGARGALRAVVVMALAALAAGGTYASPVEPHPLGIACAAVAAAAVAGVGLLRPVRRDD